MPLTGLIAILICDNTSYLKRTADIKMCSKSEARALVRGILYQQAFPNLSHQ
jgi:hypothetical protein